jgi:hypothetical protein
MNQTRRTGRKRRAIGWASLTLGLPLAAAWVWSGYAQLRLQIGPLDLHLDRGLVWCYFVDATHRYMTIDELGFGYTPGFNPRPSWEWWGFNTYAPLAFGDAYCVQFPLWPLPAAALFGGAWVILPPPIRARRLAAIGKCPACGYDLAGLTPGALCPECGRGTPPFVAAR